MKKLLLALSLLAVNAYACNSSCDAVSAVAEMSDESGRCVLSDTVCRYFDDENTGKFGIKDKNGNIVIPANYVDFGVAIDNNDERVPYIKVMTLQNDRLKTGLYDDKGKQVLSPIYENIEVIQGDSAIVRTDNYAYAIANLKTKKVVPIDSYNIKLTDSGDIIAENRSYSLLDTEGKAIVTKSYIESISDNLLAFCQNGIDKCGIMDTTGKEILAPKYKEIRTIGNYEGGLQDNKLVAVINTDNKTAFFNPKLGKMVTPFIYENFSMNDDMILVVVNDKYGFIDVNGKEVIAPIYDEGNNFDAGLAKVGKDGERFYINKQGKRVQ